ncbi:MAG: class B sortase [Lachnospiraceae bacterium]|nr:class B sortase [Candidatus Minthocola equi]
MKSRKRKNSAVNIFLTLLMVALIGVAGYSGYRVVKQLKEDSGARDYMEEISDVIKETESTTAATQESTSAAAPTEPTEATTEAVAQKEIDFEALWELNKDVVGWIEPPGTIINYPIAQGIDNGQYLRTLLNGEYHRFGTLFIDYANSPDFSDFNTIIYGHHIKAGDMFCLVEEYDSIEYYKEHPYFILYTPTGNYLLEPYAACYDDGLKILPQKFNGDEDEYAEFISEKMADSLIDTGVEMSSSYDTVSLYTCSERDDKARFVLFCRKTEL